MLTNAGNVVARASVLAILGVGLASNPCQITKLGASVHVATEHALR